MRARIFLIAAAAVVAVGAGLFFLLREEQSRPNIVLIVIDTLRADHLGVYGYPRGTSPHLDEFASSATVYRRAIASAPWTLPSHASLFTGLPSFLHGAHAFFVNTPWLRNTYPLSQSHWTLAEAMRELGFATAAFVANHGFLDESMNIDQGFDVYHVRHEPAARQNAKISWWLENLTGQPFFLFVNYMDTHRYYNTEPIPRLLETPASRDKRLLDQLEAAVLPATDPVPEVLAQAVIDQYDTGIAHVDRAIGGLLSKLRELDLYDETLVIITSDHGEYFGEHDIVEHSKDIYEQAIRVPLIIKAPGQRTGATDARIVTSVDLPRLLLDLDPKLTGSHRDVFPYAPGNHPAIVENYYARAKTLAKSYGARFDRVRTAVVFENWKFIRSSDGHHELYDLGADSAEANNRIAANPQVAERGERLLLEFMAGKGSETTTQGVEVGADEVELLEELGYR